MLRKKCERESRVTFSNRHQLNSDLAQLGVAETGRVIRTAENYVFVADIQRLFPNVLFDRFKIERFASEISESISHSSSFWAHVELQRQTFDLNGWDLFDKEIPGSGGTLFCDYYQRAFNEANTVEELFADGN